MKNFLICDPNLETAAASKTALWLGTSAVLDVKILSVLCCVSLSHLLTARVRFMTTTDGRAVKKLE